MSDATTVARRLAAAYFAYYATIGLEYVYMPFFFSRIGLTPAQVGVLYAGRIAVMIVFQPLTTRFADRTGKPYAVLKLSMLLGFLCASGLYLAHTLPVAALFMWTQSAFRSVAIPILDATTIHERGPENYGRTRLWGSIGFGLVALGLGGLVGSMAYEQVGAMALPAYLAANAVMVLTVFALPAGLAMQHPSTEATPPSRTMPAGVIALMVFGAVHWASVETYNVFFSSHVRWRGFSPDIPGLGVAAAITGEVLTFYFFSWFLKRAPASRWMVIALAASVLRWLGTAFAPLPGLLVAVQLGHACSFALWWASTLAVFGQNAPLHRRAAMQGMFTAGIMGVGGAFGTYLSGRLFDLYGGASVFTFAAGLDVLAVLIALGTRKLWWKHA